MQFGRADLARRRVFGRHLVLGRLTLRHLKLGQVRADVREQILNRLDALAVGSSLNDIW